MNDKKESFFGLMTRRQAKTAVIIFGAIVILWAIYTARTVLFPFIVAFGIAYLLDPVIDRLEKSKINRTSAILLLLLLFFSFFFLLTALLGPVAIAQVEELSKAAPVYFESLVNKVKPILASLPQVEQGQVEATLKDWLVSLGDLPPKIVKGLSASIWAGLSSVIGFVTLLINLVIIPVAAFYLLKDFDQIVGKINERIPPRHRKETSRYFKKIDAVLSGFVRGQLIVALIMATMLSSGLLAVGAPMGLVIGVIAGLANVVPYLAVVVGFVPAVLLTWLHFADWQHPLMVVGVFATAQALEGFVISPKVLEEAVGLHPVAIMAALLTGGHFFGFLGILLAVPAAAVIKVLVEEFDILYRGSHFFAAEDEKKVKPEVKPSEVSDLEKPPEASQTDDEEENRERDES